MIASAAIPTSHISWKKARRIIRSAFPPIDLFGDIAEPGLAVADRGIAEDQPATDGKAWCPRPRAARAASGRAWATYLMAPFSHISLDRQGRLQGRLMEFGSIYGMVPIMGRIRCDAAHIAPPAGAKSLNLAASDVAHLFDAMIAFSTLYCG